MIDPVLDERTETLLSRLPALSPDAGRAARVRARCHVQLARHRPASEPTLTFGRRMLAPFVAIGACGVYVYSLVTTALRLAGIF
ncbi:MAG TPA: hypothetical protein VH417_01855 [Vicinamibacterales bacterium]|jgi:hypothetical protein